MSARSNGGAPGGTGTSAGKGTRAGSGTHEPRRVLVTGGAGFIGCHLARRLAEDGVEVRVLDRLEEQTHGPDAERPADLDDRVDFHRGDVRDAGAVRHALDGIDAVVHLAAMVGVGQSMYQPRRYVEENAAGTAVLLEQVVGSGVRRLVVASSMSVYGEGQYVDAQGRAVPARRDPKAVAAGRWDPVGPDGAPLRPVPTPESKVPDLASVYALTKYDQERLCLLLGQAYGIPTLALRFFNTYGPGQALGNPYTGVLAIFASRVLNGQPPLVYEDGHQRRDFVHVGDVARACALALAAEADGEAVNVGTGRDVSVLEAAAAVARVLDRPDLRPQVLGKFRAGDVRHCFADARRAQEALGFRARVGFEDGLRDLAGWLATQEAVDRSEAAQRELQVRGLIR